MYTQLIWYEKFYSKLITGKLKPIARKNCINRYDDLNDFPKLLIQVCFISSIVERNLYILFK